MRVEDSHVSGLGRPRRDRRTAPGEGSGSQIAVKSDRRSARNDHDRPHPRSEQRGCLQKRSFAGSETDPHPYCPPFAGATEARRGEDARVARRAVAGRGPRDRARADQALTRKRRTSESRRSAVPASSTALEAISCAEALVCCVEAETCSVEAEDCSATAATSATSPCMRSVASEISSTATA